MHRWLPRDRVAVRGVGFRRSLRVAAALVVVGSALLPPAWGRAGMLAAAADSSRVSALASFGRVRLLDRIRVDAAALGRVEGTLAGSRGDSLLIARDDGESTSVSLGSVEALWVRRPAAGTWALRAGTVGAIAGGLAGGTQYVLLTQRRFNDPPDEYSLGWHLGFIALSAAIGGGLSAIGGAVAGLESTTWRPVIEPGKAEGAGSPTRLRWIGEATAAAGGAWPVGHGTSGSSPYMRLNVFAVSRGPFAFGPEIGLTARSLRREWSYPVETLVQDEHVFHAGLSGRWIAGGERLQPIFFVGGGWYSWSNDYLGASGGLGLRVSPGGGVPPLEAICTWHEPLQDLSEPVEPRFVSASLGARLAAW